MKDLESTNEGTGTKSDCSKPDVSTSTDKRDLFRYFIRKNFPKVDEISNDEIDSIGIDFHNYLDKKLNDEQKERILPKSSIDVIMNSDHPFKTNGFEPAYFLHFDQWVKDQVER